MDEAEFLCVQRMCQETSMTRSHFMTLPLIHCLHFRVKYIVGDNALCTGKIINSVKAKVMDVVSRNADHSSLSKECFEKGKGQKSQFEDIFPDDEQTPLGMWSDDCEIDGVKVKRLLVLN